MSPTPASVPPADHDLARSIAQETGQLLVKIREQLAAEGVDQKELKDEGDRQAHEYISAAFKRLRPDDAFLSEEGKDDVERLQAQRTWIVDPLDGTREFSEPPREDWAVHIALVIDNRPVAGAVALPAQDMVFATGDNLTLPQPSNSEPRLAISRTRPGGPAQELGEALSGSLIKMGSAGAKAMAVVKGEVDIYAHSGGQFEWDSCAPVAVAQAAGLHCSRIDGSPMLYNNADPYLPDLLICHPIWAEKALEILN